jgi:hypothetical protein
MSPTAAVSNTLKLGIPKDGGVVQPAFVPEDNRRGFRNLAKDAITLTNAEGLIVHTQAVKVRQ